MTRLLLDTTFLIDAGYEQARAFIMTGAMAAVGLTSISTWARPNGRACGRGT